MGKNQHSKDRLFLTSTEHKSGEHRGSGKQSTLHLPYRTLPYDCCAISFRPFETPLCTADGSVFELLNIVPYLKKFRKHPVTGQPLAASDLIKLHFHKNQEKQYACPVLYKPFTQFTHIVAIKQTGHVYCYDAVKQMCLKTNHLHDLLDETPFTRADIIHIQDPSNGNKREMEQFAHVRENHSVELKSEGAVRHNDATSRIMEQIGGGQPSAGGGSSSSSLASSKPSKATSTAAGSSSSGSGGKSGPPVVSWNHTTGKAAQSLTSTAVPVQLSNEIARVSEEEARRQRHQFIKGRKEKGYAQVTFGGGHGAVNLELYCDIAPMACENFITLIERGYYNATPVHRLIKNFMIQCGDPSGTGSGGESCYGAPFRDEISNKLTHSGGGVLSMANSGPNTNGSQFFLTFKSAKHLDGKHTIFGRVVGGLDVLSALERLPTDKEDRPSSALMLQSAQVFVNPFADIDAKMAEAAARAADPDGATAEERAAQKATDSEAWFNNGGGGAKLTAHKQGIGKYIKPQHRGADGAAAAAAAEPKLDQQQLPNSLLQQLQQRAEEPAEPPKKKPKSGGGFGNFDSW